MLRLSFSLPLLLAGAAFAATSFDDLGPGYQWQAVHDCQKNGRNGLFTEAEVAAGFAVLDSATAAEDLDAIKAICTGAFTNVPCWTDTPNAATAEHAYVDQYRAFKWDPVEGWVIFTALGSRQQYMTVCKTTV